jgi:hypothetical protein
MSGKCDYPKTLIRAVLPAALLSAAVATPALSQEYDDPAGQAMTATVEDHERFEAERRRQEQLQLASERRRQERMRLETERLRQENERRKQEQLQLENERLRQEIEQHKQEQLRLEGEARERERARAAAMREQKDSSGQGIAPDTYEQLLKLGQLRDDGILTEEEFQRLKKKVLQ